MAQQGSKRLMPHWTDEYITNVIASEYDAVMSWSMKKELLPEDKLWVLWEVLAEVLSAFPDHEHAARLSSLIKCSNFWINIDPGVVMTATLEKMP